MYADLLESSKEATLDLVLPHDQPDEEPPTNETEELAEALYGDGEKAPSSLKKVYLLEDHAPLLEEKLGRKRKRQLDTVEEADEHVDSDDDKQRPNALLLHGEPISKLGTEKIFEYVATYCDSPPTSLEWVDDRTTVIIFESQTIAQDSLAALAKEDVEQAETLIPAHPVPKKLWPPEAQLDHNLSRGTALSGTMRVRYARFGDRKLRDARKRSEWYSNQQDRRNKRSRRREGEDMDLDAELDEMRRKREAGDEDDDIEKRRAHALDAELDDIAKRKENGEEVPEVDSPRLDRRLGPKKDRQIAPLPRRRGGRGDGGRRGERSGQERPKRTQDDLDAELEAFMKARE
ncbi:hypothetical protein RhiJN_15982 [Ceratobasidium sp. AG-Ba]|nr:hypothetical protein RhiJN_15982 [Ceratobasidium sp. AG-Ba]